MAICAGLILPQLPMIGNRQTDDGQIDDCLAANPHC
jgi:hypothetical protein